jgi:hypothetical protein
MLDYLSSAITYPVDSLSAFFGAGWVIMAILSAMLIAAYIVGCRTQLNGHDPYRSRGNSLEHLPLFLLGHRVTLCSVDS